MRRPPHLHLPGPWDGDEIEVPAPTITHLRTVLRMDLGAAVTYTDGVGTSGRGVWRGPTVTRGPERTVERRRTLRVAVAPPKSRDRQRFTVEKLQELGVAELLWLPTARTVGRAPREDRAASWAVSALEQSRGSHLMALGSAAPDDLPGAIVLDPDATEPLAWPDAASAATVVIGPEGGFAPGEFEGFATARLGESIMRTETAAFVAAAVLLLDPSMLASGDGMG